MKSSIYTLLIASVFAVHSPGQAEAKEGFFIGLGLGGAVVSHDDPVELAPRSTNDRVVLGPGATQFVTTDFASGLGGMLRLGYNFYGAGAIEVAIVGHGGNLGKDNAEGQGHVSFNATIHPLGILELADVLHDVEEWDPYIIIGGGLSYGVYVSADNEEKGWEAADVQTGLGFNYHFHENISTGIDLRWTFPMYSEWIFNWDDDEVFLVEGDATAVVFTPMAAVTFHFR